MGSQCQDSSCHAGHGSTGSCGSGQSPCACSCHAGSGHSYASCQPSSCHDHAHIFLELADSAWMEVLKEKIKDQIRNDPKIDELAKIIAEANKEKWQNKKQKQKSCMSFEEKLKNTMCK